MFFWKKKTETSDSDTQKEKPSSFTKQIEDFFSTGQQKEKVLRREDFYAASDGYYAHVSAVYKVAQRFIWLFFVFFMVVTIVANYKSIILFIIFYHKINKTIICINFLYWHSYC